MVDLAGKTNAMKVNEFCLNRDLISIATFVFFSVKCTVFTKKNSGCSISSIVEGR